MSTPDKFGMGGMPRTSTGLVPSSYRSRMDDLSSPKEWSQLPTQPAPEMFPYRGDYINARNRKLQAKKAKKSQARTKPPTGSLKQVDKNPCTGPAWDSYCQHISATKLTSQEQESKAKNKQRFTNYMRSEVAKRQSRAALEKKLKAELGETKENDEANQVEEVQTKQRKPGVPRLSYFARTGKRTTSELAKLKASDNENDNHQVTKRDGRDAVKRRSYLEFISNKTTKPMLPRATESSNVKNNIHPHETEMIEKVAELYCANKSASNESQDDELRFRTRIQDIVEKAAAMVVAEKLCIAKEESNNDTKNMNSSALCTTSTPVTEFCGLVDSTYESASKCDIQQTTEESALSHANERLRELEERIKCLSLGSGTIDEFRNELQSIEEPHRVGIEFLRSDSASLVSDVTFQDKVSNPIKKVQTKSMPSLAHVEEASSNDSSVTEIFPRAYVQPTQFPSRWRNNTDLGCKSKSNDANESFDTFSWSVSLTNDSKSAINRAPEPHSQSRQTPQTIHEDDEEPMTLRVNPSAQPEQTIDWGDEPLPRGHELHTEESDVVDDILSLL